MYVCVCLIFIKTPYVGAFIFPNVQILKLLEDFPNLKQLVFGEAGSEAEGWFQCLSRFPQKN